MQRFIINQPYFQDWAKFGLQVRRQFASCFRVAWTTKEGNSSQHFSCIISVTAAIAEPTLQCSPKILALILTLTFLNDSIWNVSNEPWMVLICKNVKHFTLGNFKHFQIMKISIELLKLKILQFLLKIEPKKNKNHPHLKRWQRRMNCIDLCDLCFIHSPSHGPDTSFLRDFFLIKPQNIILTQVRRSLMKSS